MENHRITVHQMGSSGRTCSASVAQHHRKPRNSKMGRWAPDRAAAAAAAAGCAPDGQQQADVLRQRRVQPPPLQRKGDVGPPLQRHHPRPHVLPVRPVKGAQQVLHHCGRRTAVISGLRARCCCAPGCAVSQCISSQHMITAAAAGGDAVRRCGASTGVEAHGWRPGPPAAGCAAAAPPAPVAAPRQTGSRRRRVLLVGCSTLCW
jgi:hypothetical protein